MNIEAIFIDLRKRIVDYIIDIPIFLGLVFYIPTMALYQTFKSREKVLSESKNYFEERQRELKAYSGEEDAEDSQVQQLRVQFSYRWSLFMGLLDNVKSIIAKKMEQYYPNTTTNKKFQNSFFWNFMLLSAIFIERQPAASVDAKIFFISDIIFFICFYAIASMALNLQSGETGVINFGVIFFIGVGGVTTAILSTRFGIAPFWTLIIGMLVSALIGYLLAYTSLRLRSDYFAIVTIALGEVLRITMLSEPFFQTKREFGETVFYSVGIVNIDSPFEDRDLLFPSGLVINVQEIFFLPGFAVLMVLVVYYFLKRLINSPYGRVLRSIREDEDVVASYGYNTFQYKASVLAIGGAIFALAGTLLVWKQGSIFPATIIVTTTFYVWAAFIIGGKGNNKGMIVGAVIIAISRRIIRRYNISGEREDIFIINAMDNLYQWLIVDLIGGIFGDETWQLTYQNSSDAFVDLNFLQIFFLGLIIVIFMRRFQRGLLPEIPYRVGDKEVETSPANLWSDPDEKEIPNRVGDKEVEPNE